MNHHRVELTYEVELGPGEKLTLPRSLADAVGPGRWIITVQPLPAGSPVREHSAFLWRRPPITAASPGLLRTVSAGHRERRSSPPAAPGPAAQRAAGAAGRPRTSTPASRHGPPSG